MIVRLFALLSIMMLPVLATAQWQQPTHQPSQWDQRRVVPKPPVSHTPPAVVSAPVGPTIRMSVTPTRFSYLQGDSLDLIVQVDEEVFLWVFMQQPNGQVVQLFPSFHQQNNRIWARQRIQIPGPRGNFTLDQPGNHRLYAFATDTRSGQFRPSRFFPRGSSREPFPRVHGTLSTISRDFAQDVIRENRQREQQLQFQNRGQFAPEQRFQGQASPQFRRYGEAHGNFTVRRVSQPQRPINPILPGRPGFTPPDQFERTGTLNLSSSPSRADVFVNDVFVGITPLRIELPRGQHEIEVSRRFFQPYRELVTINENRERRINVRLQPER